MYIKWITGMHSRLVLGSFFLSCHLFCDIKMRYFEKLSNYELADALEDE